MRGAISRKMRWRFLRSLALVATRRETGWDIRQTSWTAHVERPLPWSKNRPATCQEREAMAMGLPQRKVPGFSPGFSLDKRRRWGRQTGRTWSVLVTIHFQKPLPAVGAQGTPLCFIDAL